MDYPTWLYVVAWLALAAGFATMAYLALEVVRRPQKMAVMNLVWPISGLYLGPLAVVLFRRMQAETRSRQHQDGPPDVIQTSVSTLHCGAGCTLGDVAGEFAVFFLAVALAGEVLFAEYVADFVIAFALGIAFQYLVIVPMRELSPVEGVRQALRADFFSIAAFQVGMFGWMAVSYFWIFDAPRVEAGNPIHWFSMQIGMVLGFLTSYPANVLLLRLGWKERMG